MADLSQRNEALMKTTLLKDDYLANFNLPLFSFASCEESNGYVCERPAYAGKGAQLSSIADAKSLTLKAHFYSFKTFWDVLQWMYFHQQPFINQVKD